MKDSHFGIIISIVITITFTSSLIFIEPGNSTNPVRIDVMVDVNEKYAVETTFILNPYSDRETIVSLSTVKIIPKLPPHEFENLDGYVDLHATMESFDVWCDSVYGEKVAGGSCKVKNNIAVVLEWFNQFELTIVDQQKDDDQNSL